MTERTEETEYIAVGRFGKIRGVTGEIYINPLTDFPEQFEKGARFWIESEEGWSEIKLRASKMLSDRPVVKIEGINNPEDARILTNSFLYIKKESLHELPEGKYYFFDLVGCRVIDEDERLYGTVVEVEEQPANDLLVIEAKDGGRYLFPMVRAYIKKIDTDGKTIIIDPPGGIFETPDES